ncbi:helix-turn-helix domain-containing protein [Candidatus Bathyarchaeota archaeon]|nr:helix-turn-helix domain-containing protein [Candidatus Bathyarchaeota archaeon]
MVYGEMERVKSPEAVLKEAGFSISERCCARPSCFDFAARKNSTLILIKAQSDIDNLPLSESAELKSISDCVHAASLIVGEKSRDKPLKDDTVYRRYEVLVVTPKTFENIVIHKTHPLIHAGPGGYYVDIDNETVKKRRQELGLSVGEMAEKVGISRRTLYGYERGMAKASVAAAYNMVYILGMPVATPINVLEKAKAQHKCFLKAKFAISRSKLLQKIFRKFAQYQITTVKKAPFDFILTTSEGHMKIIGGVASNQEQELGRRVDEILSVSKIVKAHPILITEEEGLPQKDIACVCKDELSKIRNPEDLIAKTLK